MSFSAVHVIVPKENQEKALLSAKEAGANGVTITQAHGLGLKEMDNFYNRLESESTDVNLMFIVPSKKVDGFFLRYFNCFSNRSFIDISSES